MVVMEVIVRQVPEVYGAGQGAAVAGEAGDRGSSPVRPGGAAGRDGDLVPPGLAVQGASASS